MDTLGFSESLSWELGPGTQSLPITHHLKVSGASRLCQQPEGPGKGCKEKGWSRWAEAGTGVRWRKRPEDTPPLNLGCSRSSAALPWACILSASVHCGLSRITLASVNCNLRVPTSPLTLLFAHPHLPQHRLGTCACSALPIVGLGQDSRPRFFHLLIEYGLGRREPHSEFSPLYEEK